MASEARPRYEHRQDGGITRIAFGIGALVLPALLLLDRASSPAAYVAAPVLLLAFLAFDGLRIRVTAQELAWRFGHLGFPRGRVALADIAGAEVTHTSFWEGWGIRRTRRGWLYNVSGYDAVLITRRDGKTLLLGSDEPRKLKAAIEAGLAAIKAGPAARR